MASEVQIYNLALLRLGEDVTAATTTNTDPVNEMEAVWPLVLAETLNSGPSKDRDGNEGWQFARRKYSGIDRDSITITAIAALVAGSTMTVTGTHSLIAGDMATLDDTAYDGDYDVISVSTTVSFVIAGTFVATDTGTGYWTSEDYEYRFSRPTCTRVTAVKVGGIELTDWVRQGSWILTNMEDTEVDMDYIVHADNIVVANIPDHVVDVLWRKMAVHLAYRRVQSRAFGDRLTEELETVYLPRAIAMDAREVYVKEESDSWTAAGRTTTVIE